MNKIKHVLFVCLGNTARSPAAEYLAKGLKKKYKEDLANKIVLKNYVGKSSC